MKKLILAIAVASLAILAMSCNRLDNPTGDVTGTLYGTWVMDLYEFEVGGSKDDQSGSFRIPVPYFQYTTLTFHENLRVTAVMGWEGDWSNFSYDAAKKQITFDRMIEVSDDGQIMVLYGTFDVLELSEDKLVLRQPYVNSGKITLPSGTDISASALSRYTFHRKK